jgi:DNA-binding GntR family transcriptional regulator
MRGANRVLLRDSIYHTIRHAILTGEYQPGQELRGQILAKEYHVSPSPIRDTLLRLEQENLVTVLPRQGYRVKPISVRDVQDLFAFHLLIEPACAAAAARVDGMNAEVLQRFRAFVNDDTGEIRFLEHNILFHRAVADLSGNARLAAVAFDLAEQFQRLTRVILHVFNHEQARNEATEHDAIIDAIQAHDPESASRLSYEHAIGAHACVAAALRAHHAGHDGSSECGTATEVRVAMPARSRPICEIACLPSGTMS